MTIERSCVGLGGIKKELASVGGRVQAGALITA